MEKYGPGRSPTSVLVKALEFVNPALKWMVWIFVQSERPQFWKCVCGAAAAAVGCVLLRHLHGDRCCVTRWRHGFGRLKINAISSLFTPSVGLHRRPHGRPAYTQTTHGEWPHCQQTRLRLEASNKSTSALRRDDGIDRRTRPRQPQSPPNYHPRADQLYVR